MSKLAIVTLDAVVWAAWSVVVGYAAHRLSTPWLMSDNVLTRIRGWEHGGAVYERIAIRRWKDRLPEAGTVFAGGTSKRRLTARNPDGLRRFVAETRRAEMVHWAIPAALPVFIFWNPPVLFVAMVAYAIVANVPCLVVQRYNRARIERVLARRPAPSRP